MNVKISLNCHSTLRQVPDSIQAPIQRSDEIPFTLSLSKGVVPWGHYLHSHFDPSIILRTQCDRLYLNYKSGR
jgi:hypothetical protein